MLLDVWRCDICSYLLLISSGYTLHFTAIKTIQAKWKSYELMVLTTLSNIMGCSKTFFASLYSYHSYSANGIKLAHGSWFLALSTSSNLGSIFHGRQSPCESVCFSLIDLLLKGFSLVFGLSFLLFNHIALSLMIIFAREELSCVFLLPGIVKYLQAIIVIIFLRAEGTIISFYLASNITYRSFFVLIPVWNLIAFLF